MMAFVLYGVISDIKCIDEFCDLMVNYRPPLHIALILGMI